MLSDEYVYNLDKVMDVSVHAWMYIRGWAEEGWRTRRKGVHTLREPLTQKE